MLTLRVKVSGSAASGMFTFVGESRRRDSIEIALVMKPTLTSSVVVLFSPVDFVNFIVFEYSGPPQLSASVSGRRFA